jgi:hypothetical protein
MWGSLMRGCALKGGLNMLNAIILICVIGTPCTIDTADDVIRTPVMSANPSTCFLQGQAYLAQTELGRSLDAHQQISIKCQHTKKALLP